MQNKYLKGILNRTDYFLIELTLFFNISRFNTRWLSVECFVYRRLLEAMRKSTDLATFDFFGKQKKEAFYGSLKAICNLLIARDSWVSKDLSKLEGKDDYGF